MQKSSDVLTRLKTIGLTIFLVGEDKLSVSPKKLITVEARELIVTHKSELLLYLKAHELRPYFASDGSLVIPFGSDPRYHYWRGGQSVAETEKEVAGWVH